ncbi:MAG: ParB/RepB/Spo0J family partition protein [Thermoguttaceae bacterium]
MTKEKRLGRGLEALLGQLHVQSEPKADTQEKISTPDDSSLEPNFGEAFGITPQPRTVPQTDFFSSVGASSAMNIAQEQALDVQNAQRVALPGIRKISIDLIDHNPDQPRQDFDAEELKKLSESISSHGLLQPVVVRPVNDRFQVIAGERRLRAAIQAGWTDVPVNIVDADDRQTAELAIIENLQRKDLNALEKAASFQRYLEQYSCTQEDLASRLNLDRSTIANMIRLLELPPAVQDALRCGDITKGHARALLPLGDEREQIEFCARIKQEGLNVRQTESIVQEMIAAVDQEPLAMLDGEPRSIKISKARNANLAALEQEFRMALGLKKVQLTHNARGRGKLVIHFRDHDEFEHIREHVCGTIPMDVRSEAG